MTPRELARSYPDIEEKLSAFVRERSFVASETFCNDRDVRRFFRRLGLVPRGKAGAKASETILAAVKTISRTTGADESRAKAVLTAYCKDDGRLATAVCGKTPQCSRCALAEKCAFFSKKPTIPQLPEDERPRERLAKLGEKNLTDAELLAIVIRSGIPGVSAVEVARNLLVKFGGFRALARCSPAQLTKIPAIGEAKAASIKAALEIARRLQEQPEPARPGAFLNPEAVCERYRMKLGREKRETFVAMLLDAKNRLIRDVTVSQGSLTQSIVHPREAFEPAIRNSAASVIFVHNHPSGDTTASREDIEITRRLKQTGDVIGIRVLDHVIVSEDGFTSLANKGLL